MEAQVSIDDFSFPTGIKGGSKMITRKEVIKMTKYDKILKWYA